LSSGPSSDTDINLVLLQLPNVTPEAAARFGAPPTNTFTITPALVQPTSRGAVRLASNNIGNQRSFDSVREIEVMPGLWLANCYSSQDS
jgi:hypothetical protein